MIAGLVTIIGLVLLIYRRVVSKAGARGDYAHGRGHLRHALDPVGLGAAASIVNQVLGGHEGWPTIARDDLGVVPLDLLPAPAGSPGWRTCR